jgi:hypothetical protein
VNAKWVIHFLLLVSIFLLFSQHSCAQDLDCNRISTISNMAVAKSTPELEKWRKDSGGSYLARLVFSSRLFELEPKHGSAASNLLAFVPPDKKEEAFWHTLDGFLCEKETVKEVKTLAELQARLPRDLARAVLLVPAKMPEYVSYAYTSIQDPHSDYALQMRSVCQARSKPFVAAVNSLPSDDRRWFIKKIFDPRGCHALALPEAD